MIDDPLDRDRIAESSVLFESLLAVSAFESLLELNEERARDRLRQIPSRRYLARVSQAAINLARLCWEVCG